MSRPSVRSGFVLFGAVTLVVIGMATPAQAHAIVTSSQPEPGQRLGTAPGVVVLELSEPLNPRLSRATVTDPAGQRFTGGVSGAREIRVSLSTNAQGVYRVEWTTVSTLDGHAVRGSFQFGVGVSPGGAAETGGGATPTREDLFIAVARWVEALALLLAVGMLFLRRLVRGRPELSWARPHSLPPVLLVALAAGVAVVALEAGSAAGSASPAALWSYLSTGLPGLARLLRLGFEALAVAAAFLGAPSLWLWVTGALGALASSGHGAAVHPTWWGITVDAVHLVAAGMWAGGILAMAILRPPSGWRSREAREFLVRFSPPALAAFAVTVGFGAIQALQELGALQALTGSRYGQVLLAKIALVALMVPLSIVAWRLGRPHLRYEGTVAVLVVAAAVVLAAFPVPPSRLVEEEAARAATPSASAFPGLGDLTMGGHAGQVLVGLTLDPGKADTNRALLYLLPLEGNEAAASLRAHLFVGGQPVPLSACGDTCRRATVSVQGGEEIMVRVDGPKGGTASFDLPQLPALDGSALLEKSQAIMHGLRTYRLNETLSSGIAVVRSRYSFVAPDRMESVVGGKSEAIWVGTTRYTRDQPGASWEVQQGGPSIPVPSFIWDYFKPYRDISVLGRQRVYGMPTTIVSFFGQTGGTPVWFRLWVDPEGLVRLAQMRAPGHFMDHRYFDFDAPIQIQPPTS